MKLAILYSFLLIATGNAKKNQLRECVRGWQVPILSTPSLLEPSRPIECSPTGNQCTGINANCQFSLRSFKYICCQDDPVRLKPMCPKYHEGSVITCYNDNSCSNGYKCLAAVNMDNVKLCCKPNREIIYPEPETSFRENKLVPQLMKFAPKNQMNLEFNGLPIKMGQLFDEANLAQLAESPLIKTEVDQDSLYLILIVDASTSEIRWMVPNVSSEENMLLTSFVKKPTVPYSEPSKEDTPKGIHILLCLAFRQTSSLSIRDLSRIPLNDFPLNDLESLAAFVDPIAEAGTFYAYSTEEDTRRYQSHWN